MSNKTDQADDKWCRTASAREGWLRTTIGLGALGVVIHLVPGCILDEACVVAASSTLGGSDNPAQAGAGSAPSESEGSRCDGGQGGGPLPGCQDTLCGALCVDVDTDPSHCGHCDHDCLGAACASGVCEPSTLAEGSFRSLAIAPPNLYVADTTVDATIVRLSTEGGPLEPISGAPTALPGGMFADAPYLYGAIFMTPSRTEFWRIPLSGGGFSAEEGGLFLGEARSSAAFEVNGAYLVSLESRPTPSTVRREIRRFDKQASGLGGELVATLTPLFSNGFALDELNAYVIRGVEGQADIAAVPVAGSEPSSLTNAEPEETYTDISVAGEKVVFVSTTRVGRVSAAGGESVTLSSEAAYRVLADAEFAYYFTGVSPCENGSELYRVPLSGGLPFHLASEPASGCIEDVLADADALYWLTAGGERIRKVSKH